MLEAFAAALLLGGINTIADTVSAELKLAARPIYIFARVLLVCYCVGGIVGARAKQLLMGTVGGLMIGSFVAAVYYVLTPAAGLTTGLLLAWMVFWVGFSLLDALLEGGTSIGAAALTGLLAAILAGGFFSAIREVWPEARSSEEPSLLRALLSWSAAFLPGFIVLFWKK